MSPYQVQSLIEEFLRKHLLFTDSSSPDSLDLSEDGLRSARERVSSSVPRKELDWVEPGQVLGIVEDKQQLEPVVEYEFLRRAARFLRTAELPPNPLPPFLHVRDHIAVSGSKNSIDDTKLSPFPSKTEAETKKTELTIQEPEGLDEELKKSVEKENEVKDSIGMAMSNEFPVSHAEAETVVSSEKEPLTRIGDEKKKEKLGENETKPTTAQLLDFDVEEEEEEDFDEDEGLQGEEIDETDVVFGTAQITQASMIKFMQQYPDSVLKFLMRRNLDGRPVPTEYEKIYDQWQQRGLIRGRLKRQLMRMMEWEEIPNLPIHELVGKIRLKIIDLKYNEN